MLYLADPDKFLDELPRYISAYPQVDKYLSRPSEIDKRVKTMIKSHVAWCAKNKINQTPTYLINNMVTSNYYNFSELISILESNMIEQKQVLDSSKAKAFARKEARVEGRRR